MKIYDVVPLGRLSAAEDGGGDPADAFGVCDRVDLDDLAQQGQQQQEAEHPDVKGLAGNPRTRTLNKPSTLCRGRLLAGGWSASR
jgi:hypothetical protein